MLQNGIRKIEGRVDISYGIEEIGTAPGYESVNKNNVTNFTSLYNSKHTPQIRAFTLEGNSENALSEGRGLIDREIVGWWSNSLSSKTEDAAIGGYAFPDPPPLMTVTFSNVRPVKIFDLFGDPILGEYPARFRIRLYGDLTGETPMYDRTFANDATYGSNDESRIERKIDLVHDEAAEIFDNDDLELENDYITGVSRMSVAILAWNKPRRTSKIYRFYDDIIERYGQDELKSFECIRETANNGEIKFGLVSGNCSVTLLNNKNRKFDLGYLKDLAHINKRVMPYVNGEKLGTYFIKEWDISQEDMFVSCKGNDRLIDFQDIMYEGCMPGNSGEKLSFGELFAKVLDFANGRYIKQFKYNIEDRLSDKRNPLVLIEPYLPRDSVWAVLQALCDASMSFVFVDKDDKICVQSELFGRREKISIASIDPDNAFSIGVPFYADMETNRVEVPYFRKVVETDKELYKVSNVSANMGDKLTFDVEFSDFCDIVEISLGKEPINEKTIKKINDFKYIITLNVLETVASADLTIKGTKTTFEKQVLNDEDTESIKKNALSLYTHPDSKLLQNEALASAIAKRLMRLYPAGTRSVTTDWRGNELLNLTDKFALTDRFGRKAGYVTTYLKNTVDGGFRQEVKGILSN